MPCSAEPTLDRRIDPRRRDVSDTPGCYAVIENANLNAKPRLNICIAVYFALLVGHYSALTCLIPTEKTPSERIAEGVSFAFWGAVCIWLVSIFVLRYAQHRSDALFTAAISTQRLTIFGFVSWKIGFVQLLIFNAPTRVLPLLVPAIQVILLALFFWIVPLRVPVFYLLDGITKPRLYVALAAMTVVAFIAFDWVKLPTSLPPTAVSWISFTLLKIQILLGGILFVLPAAFQKLSDTGRDTTAPGESRIQAPN